MLVYTYNFSRQVNELENAHAHQARQFHYCREKQKKATFPFIRSQIALRHKINDEWSKRTDGFLCVLATLFVWIAISAVSYGCRSKSLPSRKWMHTFRLNTHQAIRHQPIAIITILMVCGRTISTKKKRTKSTLAEKRLGSHQSLGSPNYLQTSTLSSRNQSINRLAMNTIKITVYTALRVCDVSGGLHLSISTHFMSCVYWFTLVSDRISISSIRPEMSGAFERVTAKHHNMLLVASARSAQETAPLLAHSSTQCTHTQTRS